MNYYKEIKNKFIDNENYRQIKDYSKNGYLTRNLKNMLKNMILERMEDFLHELGEG